MGVLGYKRALAALEAGDAIMVTHLTLRTGDPRTFYSLKRGGARSRQPRGAACIRSSPQNVTAFFPAPRRPFA